MTHLKILLKNVSEGGSVENVSGAVISALYNLSKDENLIFLSGDLKGDLLVSGTYLKYVTDLHTLYPDLNITALSWYIYFDDPTIEQYWANSEFGDGTGITATSALSVYNFPKRINENFKNATNVSDSNSIWNGGRFAFYGDNISSFDELGQFSNITKIPTGMFWGSLLSSIDLSNIETLGVAAFRSSLLSGIINLPKFKNWTSRDYNVSGYNVEGALFYNTAVSEVNLGSDVMSGLKVTTISGQCFLDCLSLNKVTGLQEVTSISYNAFLNTDITNLPDLNANITGIYHHAFQNATDLLCIDISNCTALERSAFSGCTSLLSLNTNDPDEINTNNTCTLNWTTFDNENDGGLFRNCKLTGKTIILPNLTKIPNAAFYGTSIAKLSAPNCTTIKGNAFYNSLIQELELGVLKRVDDRAFACPSLTTIQCNNQPIDFSKIEYIGVAVFRKDAIPNFTVPSVLDLSSLTFINNQAFFGRTEITTISSLGSITHIGERAFDDCSNLTSVSLPNTLAAFAATCFKNTKIEEFIVPEGVTSCQLGQFTSLGNSLRYVEFPSTCTSMPNGFHRSLEGNTGIDCRMVIKATTPPNLTLYGTEVQSTKSGVSRLSGIYVPDSALSAYQNATGVWAYSEVQAQIKPISLLLTDSPYCWNKYQAGLSLS